MVLDVTQAELICAAAFMGAQLAMLAGTVQSNRRQGVRIGALELRLSRHLTRHRMRARSRRAARGAVRRHLTNPTGQPVREGAPVDR